jgi:hypothetical protein
MKDHLIQYGREPNFQVWRGFGEQYSSYDAWEEPFRNPKRQEHTMGLDSKVDIQGMLQNIFEQIDDPHFEGPKEPNHHDLDGVGNSVIVEVICEQVHMAFQTTNIIQNEVSNGCIKSTNENELANTYGNLWEMVGCG